MALALLRQVSGGDAVKNSRGLKQPRHGHAYQRALEFQRDVVYRGNALRNTHHARSRRLLRARQMRRALEFLP